MGEWRPNRRLVAAGSSGLGIEDINCPEVRTLYSLRSLRGVKSARSLPSNSPRDTAAKPLTMPVAKAGQGERQKGKYLLCWSRAPIFASDLASDLAGVSGLIALVPVCLFLPLA